MGIRPWLAMRTFRCFGLWATVSLATWSCSNDDTPARLSGGNPQRDAQPDRSSAGGTGGTSGSAGTGSAGTSGHGGSSPGGAGGTANGGAGGGDAGSADAREDTSASDDASADDGGDARAAVNGCTSFVDRTADNASRALSWAEEIADSPERCMKVLTGQTVTFTGDFNDHPLEPAGGDTPNPIAEQATFTAPGVFGYVCAVHPEMRGAIWVTDP
jgi:plastocyanin